MVYSPLFKRLISASHSLTSIIIQQRFLECLPFDERQLLIALSPSAATLKILKLKWMSKTRQNHAGLDLTGFEALRLLHIDRALLLGLGTHTGPRSTYTTHDQPDLTSLIRNRLPPDLEVLLLDGVTFPKSPSPDLEQAICPQNMELLTCLVEQKKTLAPRLKYFLMYYLENMSEPIELYKAAEKYGVDMFGIYKINEIDPGVE